MEKRYYIDGKCVLSYDDDVFSTDDDYTNIKELFIYPAVDKVYVKYYEKQLVQQVLEKTLKKNDSIPTICICIMNCIEEYDKGGLFTLILYGIEGASPALAAIFVKLQKQGVNGVKTFLVNKYKYSLSARLCVIGFCIPCIMITIGKMLTYLTPYNNQFIYSLSLKKIIIVMWALVAEELGWRGYLQEKIEAHVGDVLTPLIVGIIWTVWHFHFFISGSMEVPLHSFAYGCIAESYGYFVITKISKGNIVPASLWHFSGNLFTNIYRLNPNWNAGRMEPYMIVNTVYLFNFIIFVVWRCFTKREESIGMRGK